MQRALQLSGRFLIECFAATFAIALCTVIPIGCDWQLMECGNEILAEIPSPSGAHRAVIFQRDCGATTGFTTQVSVLFEKERLSNAAGNVFSADTDHGAAPAGPGGGPELLVSWRNDLHLIIWHHSRARAFASATPFKRIAIEYGTF